MKFSYKIDRFRRDGENGEEKKERNHEYTLSHSENKAIVTNLNLKIARPHAMI